MPADLDALRGRLQALRAEALATLAEADQIDIGLLAIVAHAGAALAALEDEAEAADRGAAVSR